MDGSLGVDFFWDIDTVIAYSIWMQIITCIAISHFVLSAYIPMAEANGFTRILIKYEVKIETVWGSW
jgi:hypothetical protein